MKECNEILILKGTRAIVVVVVDSDEVGYSTFICCGLYKDLWLSFICINFLIFFTR